MPPRRGGAGDAGADVRANMPEPPVKRLIPWSSDSANTTDIIAGSFDATGAFQGITVSEASLQVIMRYFQLGIGSLPKELRGSPGMGFPSIIVTRGAYGRDKDTVPGPVRNNSQAAVWQTVRKIREDVPSMDITCVDIPTNATVSQLSSIMSPPLDEYRELAFYEGTWYVPDVVHTPKLMKQLREVERKAKIADNNKLKVNFKRISFTWRELDTDKECYQLTWKAVHTEDGYVAPVAPDLDYTEASVKSELKITAKKEEVALSPEEASKKVDECLKSAKESMEAGKLYSALWSAKQAARLSEGANYNEAMGIIGNVHQVSEKPLVMGPYLEVMSDDRMMVSFVP